MNLLEIGSGDLRLRLFAPGSFYRGTRFDWAGVFDAVEYRGTDLAGRWFERYDPTMHDAVCGPAEEFTPVGYKEGETFLKIGVGRLQADDAPYDRFKLYPIVDSGTRSMETDGDAVVFRHEMPEYIYEKTVRVLSGNSFSTASATALTKRTIVPAWDSSSSSTALHDGHSQKLYQSFWLTP